jgi:hypothetical protein
MKDPDDEKYKTVFIVLVAVLISSLLLCGVYELAAWLGGYIK